MSRSTSLDSYDNKMQVTNRLIDRDSFQAPLLSGQPIQVIATSKKAKPYQIGGFVESISDITSQQSKNTAYVNLSPQNHRISPQPAEESSPVIRRKRIPSNLAASQNSNPSVQSPTQTVGHSRTSSGALQQFEGFDTVQIQEKESVFTMESVAEDSRHFLGQNSALFIQEASTPLTKSKIALVNQNGTPKGTRSSTSNKVRISFENLKHHKEVINSKQKCQVDLTCAKMAISICSEQAYRGCTLAYCNDHSGQLNRRNNQCWICKVCSRDHHADICSECSDDILSAQRKFYSISVGLGFLVFCVLICLLHCLLQAIPGLCSTTGQPSQSQFCTSFHNLWHDISIYNRETDTTHMIKQNKAAPQVDEAVERIGVDQGHVVGPIDPFHIK